MILEIFDNKVFFNDKIFIDLENTNFPIETLMFTSRKEILWDVKVIDYNNVSKVVILEVEDYFSTAKGLLKEQILENEFQYLKFVNLEWDYLNSFLSSFKKIDLIPLLTKNDQENFFRKNKPQGRLKLASGQGSKLISHSVEFRIPLKEVSFEDGFVSMIKTFNFFIDPIEIKIDNKNVFKEYQFIKPYLIKILFKKKSINVKAKITIRHGEVEKIEAASEEINLIRSGLIDLIKRKRILDVLKFEHQANETKIVFNLDEIYDELLDSNKEDDKTIETNVGKILNVIFKARDIRNEREIRYLSNRQSLNQRIKFTLKPLFGFVFFIEESDRIYYCWELLNSHATYVWGMNKKYSMEELLEEVENAIGFIREYNRIKYRKYYSENLDELNYSFHFVSHQIDELNTNASFENWRNKVTKILNK